MSETKSVLFFLQNADLYYAHTIPNSFKNPETLNQHIELVQLKFELLVKTHNLDPIINNFIESLFLENKLNFDESIANYIKLSWVNTIVFHDYGKVNENFQASSEKMNNPNFKGKEIAGSPISTYHSSLGAYIYITKHLDDLNSFDEKYDNLLSSCVLYFSYSIFKHHSKYLRDYCKVNLFLLYVASSSIHSNHPFFHLIKKDKHWFGVKR